MHTTKIHHIAIICSNYKKSKDFYVNKLGFSIIKETFREERCSYKLDLSVGHKDIIELFSFPSSPARLTNPEACGLRHLAFVVKDIDKTIASLQLKKIAVEKIRIDKLTGKKFTFFKDPDGLPLELYEE